MAALEQRRRAAVVVLLLAAQGQGQGSMAHLAAGFVAHTSNGAHPRLRQPWSQFFSIPPARESSSLTSARTKRTSSNCNYNPRSDYAVRTTRATTWCSASSGGGSTPPTAANGAANGTGTGSCTASSPSAVVTEKVEGNQHPDGFASAQLIPLAEGGSGAGGTTVGRWGMATAEGDLAQEFEWEGGAGAAWTEFEDWLLQDTYARYVIGSGKHVLWRRMVREVPELMGRTPQEARERWLRITGRLGAGGGEGGSGREAGKMMSESPALDNFYVQPPVLEQWEEIAEGDGIGSFRGKVFGQRGLADGTAMTTAPIDVSGKRLQDQYVATQCGVVYELGERRETDMVGEASSKMLKIAPATVLALAGALYALTALSHHVQVEVFVI